MANRCGVNEWNHLQSEVNTYSYPNSQVLIVRSEEVSLEEDSCTADLACHLGAQFVNTYIPGGEFGQDIASQEGISLVNRANGLSIINHPIASLWDWCSEGNTGETGVEIWNDDWDQNDEHSLEYWVRRLLRGDRTYAFAGSDTHDGIVDPHPMNGVYLPEFSSPALKHSLKTGHSFVTNGPALVLWVWPSSAPYFEYEQFLMGSTVPREPGEMVSGQIYYNTWNAQSGRIRLYRGVIGQLSETEIATYDVSASGYIYFSDTISGANVYYRAEFVFMGNPSNWQSFSSTYLLMLRWRDANRDGLVQYTEISVEQSKSFPPGTYPREPGPGIAVSNGTYSLGISLPYFNSMATSWQVTLPTALTFWGLRRSPSD